MGARPNGLAFDGRRRHLFTFDLGEPVGTNCTASVVSIDERRLIQTIPLPGRPRWAVFDVASDSVYVNIQTPPVILRVDAATLMEVARIDIGAAGPHGLALVQERLFCAADGAELVVIDRPANGPRIAKRLPLRGPPDVVIYDDTRRRLYVAVGSPGVASVFDTDRLEEVETIQTEEGAHTLGLDPATAQLYVFAPRRGGALVFEDAAGFHTP